MRSARPCNPSSLGNIEGDEDIANFWGKHFDNILNVIKYSEKSQTDLNNSMNQLICESDIPVISPNEVIRAIKELPKGSSADAFGFSSEYYIHAPKVLTVYLSYLFSCFISHSYMPKEVMLTVIVPILKNPLGDITDKDNYRGIAISSLISKIFEGILVEKCEDYLWTQSNQFAFKKNHSTNHATFILKEIIHKYRNNNSHVYVCYLDASKAFDNVNHIKLFNKLLKRGFDPFVVKLLRYWYCAQLMYVKWNNFNSFHFAVSNGVRQGGKLSPLLFTVYIDDMIKAVSESQFGCTFNNTMFNCIAFADDIVIFAPTCFGLRKLLNICVKYANGIDMKFNTTKTKCMHFLPKNDRRLRMSEPSVYIGNHELEYVTEFKYLGHILSSLASDSVQIDNVRRKFLKSSNMILHKFYHANSAVKLTLFNAYCLSMYGSELWDISQNSAVLKKFSICYHDVIKRIVDVPRFMNNHLICNDFNLLTFDKLLCTRKLNFFSNICKSTNKLLLSLTKNLEALNFMKDVKQLSNTFNINNFDPFVIRKSDIKHIFKCEIMRKANIQWQQYLDN